MVLVLYRHQLISE